MEALARGKTKTETETKTSAGWNTGVLQEVVPSARASARTPPGEKVRRERRRGRGEGRSELSRMYCICVCRISIYDGGIRIYTG